MKQAWLTGLSPFNRLLFFFMLMIASFGGVFLAGMLLAKPLFGVSIAELPALLADFENPEAIGLLKYFQILQSFGLFIIPPLLAGFFYERSSIRYLALDRSPRANIYLLVFVALFVMSPLVNWMIAWNESMNLPDAFASLEQWMQRTEEQAGKLTEAFMEVRSPGGFLLNVLMIAVLPAFGEEFLFRGVLQRLLGEWTRNMHVAILVSAFAFSAMHLQFYGLMPRFFLGIVFGYLFWWSGSLWVPIFLHFLNNAMAVVFELFVSAGKVSEDAGSYGSDNPVAVIASTLLTGLVLMLIYRKCFAQGRKDLAETQDQG